MSCPFLEVNIQPHELSEALEYYKVDKWNYIIAVVERSDGNYSIVTGDADQWPAMAATIRQIKNRTKISVFERLGRNTGLWADEWNPNI